MTTDNWVILGRPNCGWCEDAKDLLIARGINYNYFNVRGCTPLREFLSASGLTTVPQVYRNGQLIGGWGDLKRELERKFDHRWHVSGPMPGTRRSAEDIHD